MEPKYQLWKEIRVDFTCASAKVIFSKNSRRRDRINVVKALLKKLEDDGRKN